MDGREALEKYLAANPNAEFELCKFWTELNEIAVENGMSPVDVLQPQWERIKQENPEFAGALILWLES